MPVVSRAAALARVATPLVAERSKPIMPPDKIKRIIAMASLHADTRILGEPLGWLRLYGIIDDIQVSAGAQYGHYRIRYDRAMGLPARFARAPSYEEGLSTGKTTFEHEADEQNIIDMNALLEAIFEKEYKTCGVSMVALLDRVCVELQTPAQYEHVFLCRALDKVAKYFDIGKRKQSL